MKVILIHPVSGEGFEYEADHAERILNMNTGWKRKNAKTSKSAAEKRDTKPTGIKTKPDSDCGCS